jgi:carotenoid cleavage dioxygenase
VHTGKEDAYTIKRGDALIAVFEPTFAPRAPDAPEADGYVIVPVSRFMENTSEFLIFDTQHIPAGPIAVIDLPFQMGWTPHGHWMDFRGQAVPRNGAQRMSVHLSGTAS